MQTYVLDELQINYEAGNVIPFDTTLPSWLYPPKFNPDGMRPDRANLGTAIHSAMWSCINARLPDNGLVEEGIAVKSILIRLKHAGFKVDLSKIEQEDSAIFPDLVVKRYPKIALFEVKSESDLRSGIYQRNHYQSRLENAGLEVELLERDSLWEGVLKFPQFYTLFGVVKPGLIGYRNIEIQDNFLAEFKR
jgi:hypothetical protein